MHSDTCVRTIPVKPGSVVHSSVSPVSTGLLHFQLVPMCIEKESCDGPECLSCTSQFLASLGGCQLEWHSLICEFNLPWLQPESASVVVEKRAVSKSTFIPVGLLVVIDADAWADIACQLLKATG